MPDWLSNAAQGSGLGATYMGSGQFASTDIRKQVSPSLIYMSIKKLNENFRFPLLYIDIVWETLYNLI